MSVDSISSAAHRVGDGKPRQIVVLGVSPDMQGGVASVMQVYRASGLDRRVPIRWMATVSDGGRWRKALVFIRAAAYLTALGLGGRVALAHMMMSTGGSFWRKSLLVRLCRFLDVPSVLHIHSGIFDRFHDDAPPWRQRYIQRTLACASRVIVLGDHWVHRMRKIVTPERLLTVPNGVLLPSPVEAGVGRRDGRDTLLFLGRLIPRKGIYEAIRAFALIADKCPTLRLVCGGDGDPMPVQSEIAELPLPIRERIVLAGWIEADAQPGWLRRSVALVLPSHIENLPMCLLEAQAYGVPVIATQVGAVPEAVVHGVTGFLTDVGDVTALAAAMQRLATDPDAWARFSTAARRHIDLNFAADIAVGRIESLYRTYLRDEKQSVLGASDP